MPTNYAIEAGSVRLLGSMHRSDNLPTARSDIYAAINGVYQPCITTRELSSGTSRGFAFTGPRSFLAGTAGDWNGIAAGRNVTADYIKNPFNTEQPLEVVIVSQGDQFEGTTLTRADYRVVCVPDFELPLANQIYMDPWDGISPLPNPDGTYQHNILSVFGANQRVFVSDLVYDTHSSVLGWQDIRETVIPLSQDSAVEEALRDLQLRAFHWSNRRRFKRRESVQLRTYIQANAPFVTGGTGCNIAILGCYLRAQIP